ncbi:MAG: plasmid pRiA4b ORF-3 family protein [Gammaproteobacteria bacterium]|nr:plasmid pRiA4b ORF-3 family protein [Gammaproteobacteria bacterium]
MKVSLLGAKPQIWRRVDCPSSFTLGDLHDVIQICMGWEQMHLHAFRIGDRSYGVPAIDLETDEEDEETVTLSSLGLDKEGARFYYEYDFGDSWEHEIAVEASKRRLRTRFYPKCLKAVHACPPEDCGGLFGYANLLKVLRKPGHAEYEEMLEWIGGEFDPRHVDLAEINDELEAEFAT